ncbi:WSC domain-containing protein [Crepidotus variabilis]|uniref:WSC domain-containing protein n=1 Tax=Crepidotus variabilis TaxID=179855 RepID=A0A9P6E4F0_9AGAR|nr:WSC domain-containing protein [Crepidotus variabilis]
MNTRFISFPVFHASSTMNRLFLIIPSLLVVFAEPILRRDSTDLGCWSGGSNGSPKILHHIVGSSSTTTVETCVSTCTGLGFALAGVEFANECYCGNAILYNYGSSTSCTMPCAGNPLEICGGSRATNVYTTGVRSYTVGPATVLQSYSNWLYSLCWEDNAAFGGPHILPHHPTTSIPAEEMTVQGCIDACGASGYTSAGVENGQDCWCDNIPQWAPGESTVDGECNKPCLNDATHYCGGSNRILIYSTERPWRR